MGTRRALLVLLAVLLLCQATVLLSTADRGVGVTVGEMTVETVLSPGVGYSLPNIGVINSGDEAGEYRISIGYLANQRERRPSADWFVFSPDGFSLEPGHSLDVAGRLIVPSDAEPGEYFALVKAQTVSQTEGGTSVGVAAATKVSFSVESGGWFESRVREVNRWLYESEPWIYLLPASLLLGFAAIKVRRIPFRLRIERR